MKYKHTINKEDIKQFITIFLEILNTGFHNQEFELRCIKISDMSDFKPGSIEILIDFWENNHNEDKCHK